MSVPPLRANGLISAHPCMLRESLGAAIIFLERRRMYYALNKDVYFRSYGDIGYLVSVTLFNDKVVDAIGAIFLDAIDKYPNTLNLIINRIEEDLLEHGIEIDTDTVTADALDFFDALVEDGFLVKGQTLDEIKNNTKGFTYDVLEPQTMKVDFTPEKEYTEVDSQTFLEDHFITNPKLMSFQIELTSYCNERCVHCYIPHELKDDAISDKLYRGVLNQLEEMGTWHITLSGGEPMLHPHFKNYLRAAKGHGFYVTVLSNLTLLDDEIVDIMANGNKTSAQVSLYSMSPKVHDKITQLPGSHERTLAAIEKLIENDIPVQISCPTMKENKNDFGDVLRWAHGHKIRAITDYSIMAEYNHDTSNLEHRLSPEECGEVIQDVIEWDKDYQKQVLSPDFVKQTKEYSEDENAALCGVGISTCCMTSNGNVYPCAGWQTYCCGNTMVDSLRDIWKSSPKMLALRVLRKRDMKQCVDCETRAFCSPCMVRNANESPTGDPFEISPYFCEVAKVNKDIVLAWREEHLKGSDNESIDV